MILGRVVRYDGDNLPHWWGIAYPYELSLVIAPVPFHWVLRFAHYSWWWIRTAGYRGMGTPEALRNEYNRGRADAIRDRANRDLQEYHARLGR